MELRERKSPEPPQAHGAHRRQAGPVSRQEGSRPAGVRQVEGPVQRAPAANWGQQGPSGQRSQGSTPQREHSGGQQLRGATAVP